VTAETVGPQLIDLLDQPVHGPASVRWRCASAVPAAAATVRLASIAALRLRPPAGESKRLVVESPWSQLTSECQRV
jgi:hypothetical protein